MSIVDISGSELFHIEEVREFKVRLINGDNDGEEVSRNIIDFAEWVKKYKED